MSFGGGGLSSKGPTFGGGSLGGKANWGGNQSGPGINPNITGTPTPQPPGENGLSQFVGYVPSTVNMIALGGNYYSDLTLATQHLASITSGFVSPAGTPTAQKLVESNDGGTHYTLGQYTMNIFPPITWRYGCIAKAGERTRIVISLGQNFPTDCGFSACVDLAGNRIGFDSSAGTRTTIVASAISDIGNGWRLITVDFFYVAATLPHEVTNAWIYLDNGSGTSPSSTAYNGNGIDGAFIWWQNVLPLQAWALQTQTFFDDFNTLKTIDLTDSRKPGFNWYIHNGWPESIYPSFYGEAQLPVANPTTFSLSSPSILRIFNLGINQPKFSAMMQSIATDGGTGFVGTVFSPPMLFEGNFSWDFSYYNGGANPFGGLGPAFWGVTTQMLTDPNFPVDGHWMEWDYTDVGALVVGIADFITDGANPGAFAQQHLAMREGTGMVAGTFIRTAGLWINIAAPGNTSGFGVMLWFYNGGLGFDDALAYSASTVPQPEFNPLDPVGSYAANDTKPLPIWLNTGSNMGSQPGDTGWPMFIDWIKVHQ